MLIALALMGILLIFVLKRTVLNPDTGKAFMSSLFELPVDANLVGFMLSIVSISQTETPHKYASHIVLASVLLMVVSIVLWKICCSLISERNKKAIYTKPKTLLGFGVLNSLIAILAIVLPIYVLGANA